MTLGSTKGGAVKLTDDADVTVALGIGEGIETRSACSACRNGSAPRSGRC